jgi:hypothetical protein
MTTHDDSNVIIGSDSNVIIGTCPCGGDIARWSQHLNHAGLEMIAHDDNNIIILSNNNINTTNMQKL